MKIGIQQDLTHILFGLNNNRRMKYRRRTGAGGFAANHCGIHLAKQKPEKFVKANFCDNLVPSVRDTDKKREDSSPGTTRQSRQNRIHPALPHSENPLISREYPSPNRSPNPFHILPFLAEEHRASMSPGRFRDFHVLNILYHFFSQCQVSFN